MVAKNVKLNKKTGFTIIELILSLVILVLLMSAIAVAMQSAVNSYVGNEGIYNAVNSARQSLNRITGQLRNAKAVSTATGVNECTFITAEEQDITYRYDSDTGKLWLITNDNTSDQDYLLCDSISSMSFDKHIASKNGSDYVKYVKVVIVVEDGGNSRTLAAAAVVRKNL